ncbi:MAG: hypothetical protein V3U68_00425 [Bacteroidota bacterium]
MATPSQGATPSQIADRFLQSMRSGFADDRWTDDVLVFLYRLKDQFQVVRSKSLYVTPRSWGVMDDLIQQMEERGSSLLGDQEVVERLIGLLNDLSTGKIALKRKSV